MADLDREVAGLRCREVLGRLSEYLDGELHPSQRARLEAHVRGCDWCERFGGEFGAIVASLRRELASSAPLDAALADRLRNRLRASRGEAV